LFARLEAGRVPVDAPADAREAVPAHRVQNQSLDTTLRSGEVSCCREGEEGARDPSRSHLCLISPEPPPPPCTNTPRRAQEKQAKLAYRAKPGCKRKPHSHSGSYRAGARGHPVSSLRRHVSAYRLDIALSPAQESRWHWARQPATEKRWAQKALLSLRATSAKQRKVLRTCSVWAHGLV
jgi:hypothetical protein